MIVKEIDIISSMQNIMFSENCHVAMQFLNQCHL